MDLKNNPQSIKDGHLFINSDLGHYQARAAALVFSLVAIVRRAFIIRNAVNRNRLIVGLC